MKTPNIAQKLLMNLGIHEFIVISGHIRETKRNRHHTKKGSGRMHQNGKYKKEQENA